MLALAGRLVALGLDAMAVKELRVLKHRLQSSVLAREAVELSGKVTKTAMAEDPQRETLASLLEFQNTFGNDPEAIGLVISHQLLVLKIIAGSRKPAVIEAALEHLRPEQSGSPAFLMIQQAAAPGGSAKSAKQLELLAQTLLGLCPSTSASSDATAMDPLLSPSPAAVFELQVLPLKFRQIWWKLADHRTNVDRELVEPFSRTLVTFVRRLGSAHRDARAYDLAGELYKLLDLGSVRCRLEFNFEVCKSLAALAEGCGEIGQAALWTEQMASACDSLEPRHARKTACLVKSYTLAASMKPSRDADDATASACSTILQCLREQPSGHIADYDFLLCEVVRLAQSQRTRHTGDFPAVVYLAAGFAQRYARSYPGRHTRSIQAVIQAALRHSKTSDEMQQWVTQDAVQVYIHSGTLQAVAGSAARMSMTESWLSSTDAVALDKILQALVVRYLRRSLGDASAVPLDDETLPAGQRGALLEKQLRHAFDLTSRSKYRPALQKLIPDVLSRLEKTYTLANYPLRRARIATVALCLRESHPALLQPPAAKIWLDNPNIADGVLGEDAELGRLLPDITAGWTVARAFYDGKPTIASLEPSLLAWQHIIDTSTSRVELCEQVYDTAATLVQLAAIAMYLGVLGSDGDRLRVLRLSLQMARLSGCGTDQECMHAIDLSRQCLEMGYSEKAGVLLAGCRAVTADDCISTLTKLQLRIACVEYHVAIDQLERAYTELEQAKGLRATEQPESVARHERRAYELLHARAWLVKSRLAVRNSIPGDALAAAKRAVRLLNATWAAIEHAIEGGDSGSLALADVPDPGEPEMNALSSGISKLQIAPKELPGSKTSVATSNKGASFWAVVPLCCNAMLHLSDMYAHHGLFAEANYYSERAVSIAESVQAKILLVRVQSHRCRLMTVADRLEDAELCLTRSEEGGLAGLSVARVEFYSARAALRVKEESFEEALDAYRQAVEIIDKLKAEGLCEGTVMTADKKHPEALSPFTWPSSEQALPLPAMSAHHFQQQYVDVLPAKWTAVSVCLNDDCSELYVARYRSGQSPLILRLPFSRHKPEGSDEEAFDYHTGKTELQDIIQVSNYSCHNSGSVEGKGAKSNWWAEREALDRRLHELLVNIENIWFGGFKGVFSQQARQPELLARFRKSFDDILTRYLPSRQNSKGRGKPLALDSKVLKLFIGLGSDQDGIVDLDEPLADLLYFVVDMLQFAGEHNAYDEIDFDGIAVDVLDALRSYHEACPEQGEDARHLILILDKRLQAFPWESLPCLEGASVSRVNSMLGLRERILAMRGQQNSPFDGCHEVSRKSGTYILNPSGDLASTQTTLSPALESLALEQGAKWKSMVQRTPDEEEFRTALTDSSMLLYFGHGAGSQYIRPRSIRKLDSCSDVVWLMGCSSGAVTEYGELEPSAVPFAYLMAGSNADADTDVEKAEIQAATNRKCMAVVATLWDVTDKDIDRFSLAMGEEWGLWPASEASKIPAKTPRKRERLVAPSTPQQVPKTPKARKTPAPVAKTPARSRSRSQPGRDDGKKRSLVEAVARSRDACYLRYLNGAAPVVYGVPVYLDD
ncbi:hypothetical protein B0A55_01541 [Friedmanniomyces simplex]|uniref:separase n=1 Tax=Friedmanniomyces simplex TaxID=329884 RepID=A0A4U0XYP4_9PEZI|nr:hypothetical protein B0A55_01541 [Friedmanniomyces simplex]